MTLIAHISDTHFGTEELPVCDALRTDLLRQAPDLIVLTGDITQRARAAQFRAARAFLDRLAPLPVLALPGNHDLPLFDVLTRFTRPYHFYRKHISPHLALAWESPEVAVLGVNSTRILRHKHGALPAGLVRDVSEKLKALAQPFKIVALHHPLAALDASDCDNCARGADAAIGAWVDAGADLFLGGHIHRPYCLPVIADSRQALVLQAGTAVSKRRRAGLPNSYNLIRLETGNPPRMGLEQRDYDGRQSGFVTSIIWEAAATPRGWVLLTG